MLGKIMLTYNQRLQAVHGGYTVCFEKSIPDLHFVRVNAAFLHVFKVEIKFSLHLFNLTI